MWQTAEQKATGASDGSPAPTGAADRTSDPERQGGHNQRLDRGCAGPHGRRSLIAASALAIIFVIGVTVISLVKAPEGALGDNGARLQDGKDNADGVCSTRECKVAAASYLQAMDQKVKPCDDFYKFSCGNFERTAQIPTGQTRTNTFSVLTDKNRVVIREILEGRAPPALEGGRNQQQRDGRDNKDAGGLEGQLFDKARNIYRACMDEKAIAKRGSEPLREIAAKVNNKISGKGKGINRDELVSALVEMESLGVSVLVGIGVGSDIKEPQRQVVNIDRAGLGLKSSASYKEQKTVDAYRNAIAKTLALLSQQGGQKSNASSFEKLASEVVDFEKKLVEIEPKGGKTGPGASYNPMTLEELQKKASFIPWQKYLDGISQRASGTGPDSKLTNRVIVSSPGYVEKLDKVVQAASPQVLNTYMAWHAVFPRFKDVDRKTQEILDEFQQVTRGVKPGVVSPRNVTCVDRANGAVGDAVGRWFVARMFQGNARDIATGIVVRTTNAFNKRFEEVDFLDTKTRDAAKLKLNAIKRKVGFGDVTFDLNALATRYKNIQGNPGDHFGNMASVTRDGLTRMWARLAQPTDFKRQSPPQTVNAFYNPTQNSIEFPAGVLQFPFFDASLPAYLNFGAVGAVAGHELSHGFDNNGRKFDEAGRLRDWWSNKTATEFETRTQCFVKQYSNFSITGPEKKKVAVSGKQTLGENIADNGGLGLTFGAWQAGLNGGSNSDQKETTARPGAGRDNNAQLPGLEKFSLNQMFFIAYARLWCTKSTPAADLNQVQDDVHSPGFVRVNAVVQNNKEFAEAFQCKQGTPMNPNPASKQCSIW